MEQTGREDLISALLLSILTILFPPAGVLVVAGCGADFLINILLTILGVFPGHIHGFYVLYVYFKRREEARKGVFNSEPIPGVYSSHIQSGGRRYGTIASTS